MHGTLPVRPLSSMELSTQQLTGTSFTVAAFTTERVL